MTIGDPFTVEDVLHRPIFREAKVVAGHQGLRRPVRWVHVLEVSDAANLLHGQELILTTGVGLGKDEQAVFGYVRDLVERGVSGLCIELGKYFPEVPERVRRFADRHDFPVIVFERPVRFIDITQDIHTHLIDRHHHQLVDLERISRQFLQLTLRPQGIRRILELLHRETGCVVRLRDDVGEVIAYPGSAEDFDREGAGKRIVRQPIVAMDTQVGELSIAVPGDPSEYLQLVLDRAATAIAQELLRRMSLDERRLRRAQRWMDDLLHRGEAELPSPIAGHLKNGGVLVAAAVRPVFSGNGKQPGALWPDPAAAPSEDGLLLQAARTLPAAFESRGLSAWLAPQGEYWAVLAIDRQPVSDVSPIQRTRAALEELFRRLARSRAGAGWRWLVGVGRKVNDSKEVPKAWRQAIQALRIQQPPAPSPEGAAQLPVSTFVSYDDLHIWQLFLDVNPDALRQFVADQLGPLFTHDRQHGTELVQTLEMFFACGQSKQQAAKSLFIHRQTLYYRLEQISELLGDDWETQPRRLALETALAAHRFLEAQEGQPR